jgi:hypothetical protein
MSDARVWEITIPRGTGMVISGLGSAGEIHSAKFCA